MGANRNIPDKVRAEVLLRDKRTCVYCGKGKLYNRSYALDHVVPVATGGRDTVDNLVVACKACNQRKGKKDLRTYVEHRLGALEVEKATLLTLLGKL